MVVQIKSLENTYEKLKKERMELLIQKERLHEIIIKIQEIPKREEIILKLKKIESEIDMEVDHLYLMMTAIQRTLQIYRCSEKDIVDCYEGIMFKVGRIYSIKYKHIYLKDMPIDLDGVVFSR